MNLFQQLSYTSDKTISPIPFARSKVRPEYAESEEKYRNFLLGQKRTINEIAEHMGLTYHGAHSTIKRMVSRRQVLVVEECSGNPEGNGRLPAQYTWNPAALAEPSLKDQHRDFFMGQQRSHYDFAEQFDLTPEGGRAALRRLHEQGLLVRTRETTRLGSQRLPALFTWAFDADGLPVTAQQFTQH